jgi:predicted nucleic acid-binding protein
MIILDTNVVSEPLKPNGNIRVQQWLDQQPIETLYLTATSLSELLLGVKLLPDGKRKNSLDIELSILLARLFGPRVFPFDNVAATSFASLMCCARALGRPISVADGQIAAIAFVHGFSVATRDTKPFETVGVHVVNPWMA